MNLDAEDSLDVYGNASVMLQGGAISQAINLVERNLSTVDKKEARIVLERAANLANSAGKPDLVEKCARLIAEKEKSPSDYAGNP